MIKAFLMILRYKNMYSRMKALMIIQQNKTIKVKTITIKIMIKKKIKYQIHHNKKYKSMKVNINKKSKT